MQIFIIGKRQLLIAVFLLLTLNFGVAIAENKYVPRSIFTLLSNPEININGKFMVEGYLEKSNEVCNLYPYEEDAKYKLVNRAIRLDFVEDIKSHSNCNSGYVLVEGILKENNEQNLYFEIQKMIHLNPDSKER